MSRMLAGCRVEDLDEMRARSAGAACAVAGMSDVVDAAVIVGAAARADLVVTSGAADLSRLRDALGVELQLHEI